MFTCSCCSGLSPGSSLLPGWTVLLRTGSCCSAGAGPLWSLQGQLPMRPGTHFWLRIYRGSSLCALFSQLGT